MHALWYPKADRSQDRSQFGYSTMARLTKCLLHSTETQTWPGYPSFAPQLTYDPWRHLWRQHMPVNRSASTLADPSWTAVRENRDDIVQVEIVGYCDPQRWASYGKNVEKMDARAISELGRFIAWLWDEWEVPLTSIVSDRWISYPKSYGYNADQRLSGAGFDGFNGVLGHQHASGNSHGDPGHINIVGIMNAARGVVTVPLGKITINGQEHDDIPVVRAASVNEARGDGTFSRHTWYVQRWLDVLYSPGPALPGRGGWWDAPTQAQYNKFRRSIGITGDDAEGPIGIATLEKLRAKAGGGKPVAP